MRFNLSRGALHTTPAERLPFLSFETDAANILEVPRSSVAAPRGPEGGNDPEDPADHFDPDEVEGHSLLQLSAKPFRASREPQDNRAVCCSRQASRDALAPSCAGRAQTLCDVNRAPDRKPLSLSLRAGRSS